MLVESLAKKMKWCPGRLKCCPLVRWENGRKWRHPNANSFDGCRFLVMPMVLRERDFGVFESLSAWTFHNIHTLSFSLKNQSKFCYRWLDFLLSRIIFQAKAFISNALRDRREVSTKMTKILQRLAAIETQQNKVLNRKTYRILSWAGSWCSNAAL